MLGLVGEGPQGYAALLDIAGRVVPASGLDVVLPILEGITATPRAGLALLLSMALGVWFVSAYLGAFGRAMNRIYAVPEGRPLWKLQPLLMALTVVFGVGASVVTLLVVLSGPLATAVGEVLGLGSTPILLWEIAKWPLLLGVVVAMVAVLYYLTPNLRQPRFRWLSPGAVLAILTWVAGSALFGLYVANATGYSAAYGSLAGVIVVLVWLWVTNSALLLGAELDAEIERARELQAGLPAEHAVQLPPRDTRASDKAAAQHEADVAAARKLRDDHSHHDYANWGD
ncbi:MAG: YihY/virulence factor BrkB family protein [Actinomycetes bacterium]